MNGKKTFLLTVLAAVFIMVIATGCGNDKHFAEYREWYKALKVESTKGITLLGIIEEDDCLGITVKCADADMDAYNGLIQRHNEFVNEHPGYFGDDISVYIILGQGSKKQFNYQLYSYNKPREGISGVSAEGIHNGENINYIQGDLYDFARISKACNTEYPEQVLVLETQDPGFYSLEDYKFLEQFSDLEQIILKYNAPDYDMTSVFEAINIYSPGVEIYQVVEDGELKKWQ